MCHMNSLSCCLSTCKVKLWTSCVVTVDLAKSMDVPLLKKYGIYNSGIVPQERYTPGPPCILTARCKAFLKEAATTIDTHTRSAAILISCTSATAAHH